MLRRPLPFSSFELRRSSGTHGGKSGALYLSLSFLRPLDFRLVIRNFWFAHFDSSLNASDITGSTLWHRLSHRLAFRELRSPLRSQFRATGNSGSVALFAVLVQETYDGKRRLAFRTFQSGK